jgi:hypothetical protein
VTKFIRQTPCAVLLAVQFLGILLYPFLEDSFQGRQLFALAGILVLALAVFTLRVTPALLWVAAAIASPAVGLLVAQVVTGNENLAPWASGFEAVVYFYAAGAMAMYMLADDHVSTDEFFAIPLVFTLMAWAFAHVYAVLQALDPGSFAPANLLPLNWTNLLFLSITNMTATGLSDILPASGHARSVVMLQQVAGVFYVAMVVARLVTISGRREPRADNR